jgi:hypothetical protein
VAAVTGLQMAAEGVMDGRVRLQTGHEDRYLTERDPERPRIDQTRPTGDAWQWPPMTEMTVATPSPALA